MSFRQSRLARIGRAATVVIAAAFLPSPAAAAAQTSIRVVIEGSFTGTQAPLLLALDRGYYRAEGLDPSIEAVSSPPDVINRVASGAADIGFTDINALIRHREQNPTSAVKAIFVVYNKPPYAIISRKSRGIAGPKDLEGKRIGAPATETASALWPVFAKLNGIDMTKVKIDNVAAAVREPMLAAGQVDGVIGSSLSTYLDLKERGVPLGDLVTLQMANYGLQLYGEAIVVSADFAAEQTKATKGFLRAYVKGVKESIRNLPRAVDSVVKRNDAAKKEVEIERLRMALQDNILTEEVEANGLGAIDAKRFAQAVDQLAQAFKFKTKPEASDIFDASFLPPLGERRITGTQRPG